jgi:hypothetical protein
MCAVGMPSWQATGGDSEREGFMALWWSTNRADAKRLSRVLESATCTRADDTRADVFASFGKARGRPACRSLRDESGILNVPLDAGVVKLADTPDSTSSRHHGQDFADAGPAHFYEIKPIRFA